MRWRLYYADGSRYAQSDGSPYDAPAAGLIVIAQQGDGQPRALMHGKDYAYWRPDLGWTACDIGGLWDYLLLSRGPKAVLIGRSIRDEDYWALVRQAAEEPL